MLEVGPEPFLLDREDRIDATLARYKNLAEKCLEMMETLKELETEGRKKKDKRPVYTTRQASELLQLSDTTLRKVEAEHGIKVDRNDRGQRVYTLEVLDKIREAGGYGYRRPKMSTMAKLLVANQKGGVAKTTTTAHLAVGLARLGLRCLAVDLDPQGTLTKNLLGYTPELDVTFEDTMGSVLAGSSTSVVHLPKPTHIFKLDVIPCCPLMANAEIEAVSRSNMSKAEAQKRRARLLEQGLVIEADEVVPDFLFFQPLRNTLDAFRDRYDVILMDTSPSMSIPMYAALGAANCLIVPTPAASDDAAGALQFATTLFKLADWFQCLDSRWERILFTKFGGEQVEALAQVAIEGAWKHKILQHKMPDRAAFRYAADQRSTLFDVPEIKSPESHAAALRGTDSVVREIHKLMSMTWDQEAEVYAEHGLENWDAVADKQRELDEAYAARQAENDDETAEVAA